MNENVHLLLFFQIPGFQKVDGGIQTYGEQAEETDAHEKPIHFEEVKGHPDAICIYIGHIILEKGGASTI